MLGFSGWRFRLVAIAFLLIGSFIGMLGATAFGVIEAQVSSSPSVLRACVKDNNGQVSFTSADCKAGATEVQFYSKVGSDETFLTITGKAADADTLDGLDSTTFLGSGGKAVDADKLDGKDSTDFLESAGKATDADKLDGVDGTAFQRRVMGSCVAEAAIQAVNADGTVLCQGFGDISGVSAGAGLTGGATSGAASLGLAPAFQLPQVCAEGQIPQWAGPTAASWTCVTNRASPPGTFWDYEVVRGETSLGGSFARCSKGKVAIGGGGGTGPAANTATIASYPTGEDGDGVAQGGTAFGWWASGGGVATAWVICARITP